MRLTDVVRCLLIRPRGGPLAGSAVALVAILLAAFATAEASTPPGDGALLVADLRSDALLALAPATLMVRQRFVLPGGAHELLELPHGRVLVSIEQQGRLVAVDTLDGRIEVIEVGGVPHGLALAGGEVLVTDRAVDAIRRFELDTWAEGESIPTGGWPHAVGVTPSGALAVAAAGPGTLELDDRSIEVGGTTQTLDIRADGAIAAAAATSGVVVLYAEDGSALGRWDVSGRRVRVRFDEAEATLAVALSADGAVAIIDRGGTRHVSVRGVPDGLAFSPDGAWLYVSDVFGGAVSLVEIATGEVRSVGNVGQATGAMLFLER